jgi:hypothetical protein
MAVVFKRVTVSISPDDKSKLVEWELDNRFTPTSGAYTFYVERAYSAGSWTRLNPSSPVTNQNYYSDSTEYKYGLINNNAYRVVLVDGSETYISTPAFSNGYLTWNELKILRSILRQEYKRLTSLPVGIDGWLLRRRHWGTACTACTDFDLSNAVVNSSCTTCYGTGIVGGYYNAYAYYMEFVKGEKSELTEKPPFGTEDNIVRQGRGVAYPLITGYDIWVSAKTDDRYLIRTVQTVAEMKETPVIYAFSLHELPADRIEYSIPLEQSTSSGSGDEIDQSWRISGNNFLDDIL